MKSLKIRGMKEILSPLALAPMVGLSHSALRSLCVDLGGVGLLYTEMLSARRIPGDNEKVSPFLIRYPEESPLLYQLYISDLLDIGPAVEKIEKLKGDGIDINLGCPAPKLRRQGAGVYLSRDLGKLNEILTTFRKLTELPLTVKIRIGETTNKNRFIDYCKFLEGCGVDLITVHARLDGEKFCRKPRWEWVAYAKSAVSVPVLANGGIFTPQDAKKCIDMTEADGLVIGRGGVTRPWLFNEIASLLKGESFKEPSKENVFITFIEKLKRFPEVRRLGRLKQFATLYSESFMYGHHLATAVQRSNSIEEAEERANQFFLKTKK